MKRYIKKFPVFVFILTVLFAAAGCSNKPAGNDAPDDITVIFIPKLTGNAFFEEANNGAQKYAAEHGFKVDYRGNSKALAENQVAIIRDAIKEKAAAICVSSLDAAVLDPVLKEAAKAGIKVVTWDSDVSGDARTVMVSQGTPTQLGRMLVEMSAKSLSERGKDPNSEEIKYAWHYSQASVADQNSWQAAGELYIREAYPNWVNVNTLNYYSEQNEQKAIAVGNQIFDEHPDIDLIICNDSTALPCQAKAAQDRGLKAEDVTITGFASPNAMREYCKSGVITRWGLWDCQVQGALGCYLAYYLASGNTLAVGDRISAPGIGLLEVMPNTALDPSAYTAKDSGVVLLPDRLTFTIANVDNYNF